MPTRVEELEAELQQMQKTVDNLRLDKRIQQIAITSLSDDVRRTTVDLPHPPILMYGIKDSVEAWVSKIRHKFQVNSEQFPTEEVKMAYVENRCGPDPSCLLFSRLEATSPIRFRTAEEMFDVLNAAYPPSRAVRDGTIDFYREQMTEGQIFDSFRVQIIEMFSRLGVAPCHWKLSMWDLISPKMQKLTCDYLHDDSVTFQRFCLLCDEVNIHLLCSSSDAEGDSDGKSGL
jgi:hypothetical protein